MDVPREWPELLPALSEAVKSDNEIIKHRGLLYLHHTIKVGLNFSEIKIINLSFKGNIEIQKF